MSSKFAQESRVPFWGTKLNKEVKFLSQIFSDKIENVRIDKNVFRSFLKGILIRKLKNYRH